MRTGPEPGWHACVRRAGKHALARNRSKRSSLTQTAIRSWCTHFYSVGGEPWIDHEIFVLSCGNGHCNYQEGTGATDLSDGNLVVPEIPGAKSDRKGGGGSNPISDTLSSTAKGFGDAVSNAVKSATGLGGGSTDKGGEE
jgi:hypothetical protein